MYQSDFELGHVALYVKNINLQTMYYQQVLGMDVISKGQHSVDLGVEKTVLVRLIETSQTDPVSASYGLYHLAIVLPSREDLGDIFKHFLVNKVPLVGASDHDYSEAIYLEDTEGNGIEIYRDRPMSDWDIREDGQIIGGTKEMEAEAIYTLGKHLNPYKLPLGSRMGHIHLSVRDSRASSQFYQDSLDLIVTSSLPVAAWLASGKYHHHLAVNEWAGPSLQTRQEGMPGLAYYTVIYQQERTLKERLEKIAALGFDIKQDGDSFILTDSNGIKTRLELGSQLAK
ncbi:VOC family protein [Streptococcus saliviloxodontae]|uniref:Catechol 2,3-dioxygenase n=1 Tax=Streptococcus saliviloxodontae TaxID=1349416 RepID=A0ABS2PK58_9STRE|nr:VOC family protein [Streptococcus saliviloxodontae]MBM7635361.1 catechol 2,3-dioxygenase [Streptococcus saliviloxodontae]